MAGLTLMSFLRAGLSKYCWLGKIFLPTGISNRNIFCMKKKKNVVVYSNIHKFVSSNLTYNIKIKEKLNLDLNRKI